MRDISSVQYNEQGLVPAIIQDANSRQVLMMAWMNRETLTKTIETGETYFWSRSRQEIWHKGETSGSIQKVQDIQLDCDSDALLIQVTTSGPACHTGAETCFIGGELAS